MERPEIVIRKEDLFFRILKVYKAPHWHPMVKLFEHAVKASGTPSASVRSNIILSENHLRHLILALGVKNYRWVCLDKETKQTIKNILSETKRFDRKLLQRVFKFLRKTSGHKLRAYQKYGMAWMARRLCSLNADDTGLGKTMQILGLLKILELDKAEDVPAMVIGSNIAGATWMDETELWLGVKLTFVETKKAFRYPEPGEILFCTWGRLPKVRELRVSPPSGMLLIGDEIQAVKNPKAQRTRSWNALKAMTLAREGRVVGLSATPLENNPGQFWEVLFGCGIEKKCFGDFETFRKLYHGRQGIYGMEWDAAPPDPIVKHMIAPWVLRRKKYDVRDDLPEIMPPRFIRVEIPKRDPAWAEMRVVEDYIKEHNLSIEEFIKLAQRNEVDFLNLSRIRRICALAKVKALEEYIAEHEDEKLIIMCCHREPIEVAASKEGWAGIYGGVTTVQRNKIKKDFNEGRLRGVACTIRSANESITLTAASRMCFVDQDYNPGKNYQAQGRNNRYGQESDRLFYDYLVIKDSIDEQVQRILTKKEIWIQGTM